MENTERAESLQAIDAIAEEIHNEYAKVGEQTGHKLPAWKDTPEAAKTMPRTLARLMLSKLEKVYFDTFEKAKKAALEEVAKSTPAPAGAKASPEVYEAMFTRMQGRIKDTMEHWFDLKRPNPLEDGIDNAIKLFSEKMAVAVLSESPELQAKLKEGVSEALLSGLLGDGSKDDKED